VCLVVPQTIQHDDTPPAPRKISDQDIDDCRFRMFGLGEIANAMQMAEHTDGQEYVVTGNKRERMAQYGNAVTPPAMRILVDRVAAALDEKGS
jgi:DNA (cytosine-5)-methyltransferase 1